MSLNSTEEVGSCATRTCAKPSLASLVQERGLYQEWCRAHNEHATVRLLTNESLDEPR
jgi:hypothetical protein